MVRFIVFSLIFISLTSCTQNQKLCDCIDAGNVVNKLSASFFNRDASQEGKDSLNAAIIQRDQICAPFLNMDVTELQKAKLNCKQLDIESNRK
jgi:hypothetical protein